MRGSVAELIRKCVEPRDGSSRAKEPVGIRPLAHQVAKDSEQRARLLSHPGVGGCLQKVQDDADFWWLRRLPSTETCQSTEVFVVDVPGKIDTLALLCEGFDNTPDDLDLYGLTNADHRRRPVKFRSVGQMGGYEFGCGQEPHRSPGKNLRSSLPKAQRILSLTAFIDRHKL